MNIKHHPDDATIMAYAAGTLDEPFAVAVSCHMEICPHCREALKTAEMIGGAELEACDEAGLSAGSFGRLLEKISASGSDTDDDASSPQPSGDDMGWDRLPRALSHYLEGPVDDVRWKRVGPGVWQKPIDVANARGSTMRLLRIAPGKAVPEHGHGGQELTLILQGAYEDELGHFGAGDVADLDDHVEHQPRVVGDCDCICLAVTEAPTRFKGLASRLLQPLIGI